MEGDVQRYLKIRSAFGPSIGPDETLSVLLETTGVSQVWTVDEPGGWPRQRTFYDDRVSFAVWSPTRPEFIFGKDRNGNERDQLFLYGENGTVRELTAMPEAKHHWGGWSNDGERFAFTSNRREASAFNIYVQRRDETGDDAELVYEGDSLYSVGDWSPSDDRLVVREIKATFDSEVYVLDVESGDLRHMTPHEGDVRYKTVRWGPDGDALYLCTDVDADTLFLARLDLKTNELSVVREGGNWNIEGLVLDADTGRLVYSRNVDGYTELTVGELVGETTIREFPQPVLPDGIAGGVSFGPDAERFAATVSADTVNTNVYVVDTETGASQRWTYASTAGLPESSFWESDLIHYKSFDGLEVPAFFTLPIDDPKEELPVIVDIHGGPASQRRPSFSAIKQFFLAQGYAFFEPNVRGSSGYGKSYMRLDDVERRVDAIADLKAGVEWLHGRPAIDPDRVVVRGGSYGGFMVLAALTEYPSLWAAGIDIAGIADFVSYLQNTNPWRRRHREAEYGSLDDDREFLESISPVNNINRIKAPLFVLHGENDPRVPVEEAKQIAEGAQSQGVPVEELIYEDEGHRIAKRENRIEAYSRIVEFLDTHV